MKVLEQHWQGYLSGLRQHMVEVPDEDVLVLQARRRDIGMAYLETYVRLLEGSIRAPRR